jgi:hypothetical protein
MDIAINSEASIMIFHDDWYYLLVNHGSCCAGANSSYSIRMGRSRKITGPFVDSMGVDMLKGGGKLLLSSGGRQVGAGHFGLLDLGDGVQKFSCHFEADLDRGGASVLDIRPLLWRDGWPVAGENFREGVYEIESARTGTDRALTATPAAEVTALAAFTGAPEQLWRIDQLADGSYRVMPKAIPNTRETLALSAVGSSRPTLARFKPESNRQRWLFKTP